MKNYKKALLATMVVATMPLMAAGTSSTPIKVTTFEDEDGDNLNACSLREALQTAEKRVSFGGCAVTDILPTTTKVIQLEKGVYTLKKELTPTVSVSILGASPANWEEKNVLLNDVVNQYPGQIPLKTTIKAENSRIFNTTRGASSLTLTNLILTGGRATDFGGAIYAGADVVLQSSQILDSQATKEGGAIFMAGPSSKLTILKSLIQGNKAEKGSVLSMDCMTDARYIQNTAILTANSFVANGSQNSSSMFEFCGEVTADLSINTIAKNIVNSSTGNLIKFTGDTKVGTDPDNRPSILSDSSTLKLKSNTIVENTAFSTLLYDKLGTKELVFNVLAYNGGANSYACRYLFGGVADQEQVKFNFTYNAVALKEDGVTTPVNNVCDVPKESLKNNKSNINVSKINMSTLLSSLQTPSAYTAFMPMYYPKKNVTEIQVEEDGKTVTKVIGLLDVEGIDCSSTDQRGLARITNGTLFFDPTSRNLCDIGSVELMQFKAADVENLNNVSISNIVNEYQSQYDFFDNLVKNPNDPDFLTYYKFRLADYERLLKYTKDNLHYRALYLDLTKLPLPQDVEEEGKYRLQFFDPNIYEVKTEPLGTGLIDVEKNVVQIDEQDKENLVCTWNNELQRIIFYRKDDKTTSDVDKVFCKYTITLKSDKNVTSSGLIKASFENIAPVVTDTTLTFKYQAKQKLSLNLLDFANDDGDTGKGGPGPENNPNKPRFWRNADGVELPIRLSEIPTKDLSITADRQGPCPTDKGTNEKATCYGGNIYVQEVNIFNPANFEFKYQVYDADGVLSSNTGTVRTISTATTTDDTRKASSGGGSLGFYSVFGLLGLLVYRRFRK